MSEHLFREKSLKRIQTPDRLNDTIKVVNPGVWLLLVTMILLLAGALCWAVLGTMDVTVPAEAIVTERYITVNVVADNDLDLEGGMKVKIFIDPPNEVVLTFPQSTTFMNDDTGYMILFENDQSLPDGTYQATIITEEIRPLSFLLN